MKLIIDIPEHILDTIQADEMLSRVQLSILQMHILNGTPLDDVKAEIQAKEMVEADIEKQFYNMALGDVIDILDNIGEAESMEDYDYENI